MNYYRVAAGLRHIPPHVAGVVAEHLGQEDLTQRELEVLRLVRDGNRNKQITNQLSISETTVNVHIKKIMDKLQANDRTHAVTIALRRGLLEMCGAARGCGQRAWSTPGGPKGGLGYNCRRRGIVLNVPLCLL
jgi:DNA-binding CsgD family transcriptional regulator